MRDRACARAHGRRPHELADPRHATVPGRASARDIWPTRPVSSSSSRIAPEDIDAELARTARSVYADLVRRATDRDPDPDELEEMSAYAMAATVDFGLDAKQGLLDLRSENARLRLVTRLFRAALKRLDFVDRAEDTGPIERQGQIRLTGPRRRPLRRQAARAVRGGEREHLGLGQLRTPVRRGVAERDRALLELDLVGEHALAGAREPEVVLRVGGQRGGEAPRLRAGAGRAAASPARRCSGSCRSR